MNKPRAGPALALESQWAARCERRRRRRVRKRRQAKERADMRVAVLSVGRECRGTWGFIPPPTRQYLTEEDVAWLLEEYRAGQTAS